LLKAVYCGWREDKLAKNAEQISNLGRQLYARLVTLGNHLSKLGNHLDRAVSTYNDVIGSIERNAFPAARRFEQLGAASGDAIPELVGVDHLARPLQAAEWRAETSENALDLNTLELAEGSGMPS
jgi:DNA recombination protein RmuC